MTPVHGLPVRSLGSIREQACLFARFPILFSDMKERAETTISGVIQRRVDSAKPGTFFRRADFAGSEAAIDTALSRMAKSDVLFRVRKGLYWKGKSTRFGMTRPTTLEAAIAIGGAGSGPSGIAAANVLGLTTQVPGTVEIAVPGKVPDPFPGVRFRSRPDERRTLKMRPMEIAVLEILRDPSTAEVDWEQVVARLNELAAKGLVRPALLAKEARNEPHVAARSRVTEIIAFR
jgi:Family of unknown function (DUF6088)